MALKNFINHLPLKPKPNYYIKSLSHLSTTSSKLGSLISNQEPSSERSKLLKPSTPNDLSDIYRDKAIDYEDISDRFSDKYKSITNLDESHMIFELIFNELSIKYGESNMIFPKNITWLSGAPGSGKSEMTPFIMDLMDIKAKPLQLSSLLVSPELESIKSSGKLVNDRIVLKLLLQKLLSSKYQKGVLIDGFPRTKMQAEFIGLLFDKMIQLRRKYIDISDKFRRPVFHITMLYIDEDISIERQLSRANNTLEHNKIVDITGFGNKINIRSTDINIEKAKERYQYFKNHIVSSIQIIKHKFPFHFINAEGNINEVKNRIKNELKYQSSAELGDDTYEMVKQFPLAAEIRIHGRHELVTRLDRWCREKKELMIQVMNLLKKDFLHIIKQQATTGRVKIRSNSNILRDNIDAATMLLDILSERGYKVILDIRIDYRPSKVDLNTGDIIWIEKKVFIFDISFPAPQIRHASQTWKWNDTLY